MASFKMEYEFKNGSYHTPPDVKQAFWAKIFPSLYFYIRTYTMLLSRYFAVKKGKTDMAELVKGSFWELDIIEKTGIRVFIDGVENILNMKEPCVFVANHMSTAETFIFPGLLHPIKPVTFVLKRSLMNTPVIKDAFSPLDPIVVTRDNPKEDFRIVMDKGVKKLQEGISVVVFPQTTRTTIFDEKQFNSMGVKLARKAGVPIVPIAVKTDAWSTGKIIKDFGKIRPGVDMKFQIGSPIHIKGKGDEEHQMVINFIKSYLRQWGCNVKE